MRWRRTAEGNATLKTANGMGLVWPCMGKWGGQIIGAPQAEAFPDEPSARRGVETRLGFGRNARGAFYARVPRFDDRHPVAEAPAGGARG